MKCHSYMAVNGYLQWVDRTHRKTTKLLNNLVQREHIGGWDKAIFDATEKASREKDGEQSSSDESSGSNTPSVAPDGTITSYIDPPTAQILRNRIIASIDSRNENGDIRSPSPQLDEVVASDNSGLEKPKPKSHPLVDHPDELIATTARNLTDMELELTSKGVNSVRWPANISLANFADYQLIPTLVYELEYPRTEK